MINPINIQESKLCKICDFEFYGWMFIL